MVCAYDFHTRHVNVDRRLSNLRVDRYTLFRTTKRSVTRDDTLAYRLAWQISIPVSLFSRDRKVRCKRAQAHVPLKD